MKNYKVIENQIPTDIYQRLRINCGLSSKTDKASQIGLKNSIHSMMIEYKNEIIGMGRIIGDGGCFCQIVDICILPKYQGKGLGKVIMGNLTEFVNDKLPESCYVSLIADGNASFLYEKFRFKNTMPESKRINNMAINNSCGSVNKKIGASIAQSYTFVFMENKVNTKRSYGCVSI